MDLCWSLTGLPMSHRLLEQQLGAWRLTVQSEQGVLEDRCSEMEVTMETMRQQNDRMQDIFSQVTRSSNRQLEVRCIMGVVVSKRFFCVRP